MSSKPKSSSKVAGLLATIKQNTPTAAPAPQPEGPSSAAQIAQPVVPDETATPMPMQRKETKRRAGRPVQFWIHEEDRRLLRELSAWLAGQGERPSDSMVIRSALRVTKTGGDFLKAYRQAAQLDGRLKQRKSA